MIPDPLPDPRLLTCCLAIDPDMHGHGVVCKDTKGHSGLHEFDRVKEKVYAPSLPSAPLLRSR